MAHIVDDLFSILHIILGFLTALFKPYTIIIPVAYILYEIREKELIIDKLGDFIEFAYGYILGDIVVTAW